MHYSRLVNQLVLTCFALFLWTCGGDTTNIVEVSSEDMVGPVRNEMSFQQRQIIDRAQWWWAMTAGDVTGDGLQDVIAINNNASGGYLAYYTAQESDGIWEETVIAAAPPAGGTFAAGDLEVGDIDKDGDLDVLAVKHTGEWDDAGASAVLFWYENRGIEPWSAHLIGDAPDAVKDLSLADFDQDGLLDLAVLTFDEGNLSVHRQLAGGGFERVLNLTYPNLHEGMDVGDFDGDGDPDIVANGNIFANPGGDLKETWKASKVSEIWNNQSGDWSRNATKAFARDVDGDKIAEVFISHSERAGYPLVMYQNSGEGKWTATIIADSIPACHTLQVFDMDLDGDLDVVAGVNRARAISLGKQDAEVLVFVNEGDYKNWTRTVIQTGGIYNGRVIDFEGDGDYDLFRYPDHESKELYLLLNQTR